MSVKISCKLQPFPWKEGKGLVHSAASWDMEKRLSFSHASVRDKTIPQKGGLKTVKSKNIAFKVLLVLNNAPGQAQDLCLTYPNIEAKNLSNQTTSLLQLLNQRVITKFKQALLHLPHLQHASDSQTFVSIQWNFLVVAAPSGHSNTWRVCEAERVFFNSVAMKDWAYIFVSISECWQSHSKDDYTVNIKQTNDELKSMALNGYWKKCWLEALSDFQEFSRLSG